MKLYRKKLNSLEELKRECIRLNYVKRHTDTSDLLPALGSSARGNKKKKNKDEDSDDGSVMSGIVSTAMAVINGGSPLQTAMGMVSPVMKLIGKSNRSKRLLGNIAKELIIGYLAGKGVQLAIKGFKRYMRNRKEKKLIAELAALEARK